jgi:putative CocE/NonD family hydrolase
MGQTPSVLLDDDRVLLERDVRVRVSDGTVLSMDVYRPNGPGRFPGLLEHIPYRKDDLRAMQDRGQNIELVRAGFACVRLDVRGTGSSGGIAVDEYSEAEQRDGVEIVDWIGRQPWCSGAVGSWGKSYGGFSCIQLAMNRPPALRAIAPVFATDDRYSDDMHFDGGALCAFELTNYPIRMMAMNALPPAPAAAGSELAWQRRIEETPAWVLSWLKHQHDGPYWRNGSLRPLYERIEVPVFIVSGWRDGYRTAGLRMAQNLDAPWQLLAGPWAHFSPDRGVPGPGYPFTSELIDFFQRYLGNETATRQRPRSVFFLGHYDSPSRPHETVSGGWCSSDGWPDGVETTTLSLGAPAVAPASVTVGVATGNWCPPPPQHGQFLDQRVDEARSAVFTGDELSEPVGLLGSAVARFSARHRYGRVIAVVKLSDVTPDGSSQFVTRGALNAELAGDGELSVPLMATGWRFLPGHRIRVAVAVNDWPCLWPLPTLAPLVITSPVTLQLPGLPPDLERLKPGSDLRPVDWTGATSRERPSRWEIVTDVMSGEVGVRAFDEGEFAFPNEGLRARESHNYWAFARDDDPLSAWTRGATRLLVERPGLRAEAQARGRFWATAEEFWCDLALDVTANGQPFARRRWRERVNREGL